MVALAIHYAQPRNAPMLWNSARNLLFRLPAETAHETSMAAFDKLLAAPPIAASFRKRYSVDDLRLNCNRFGLDFKNPVGLAAGFDKNAKWFPKLACLGFSHVEVGTITGQAQPGNPQPRLFRLPTDRAIINRMGFNNEGSDAAARRLAGMTKSSNADVLGINIGKTKVVPVEEATADYLFSFERLFAYADYFTVNVSSPNTPGLRTLQNREPLIELLGEVLKLNQQLATNHEVAPKPVLLKIAPDLTDEQLEDIVAIATETGIAGVIATNTTPSRDGLQTPPKRVNEIGNGGLSGAPLTGRSRDVVHFLFQRLGRNIPIVGVGGIMDGEDAWQMIRSGASLIQLYTGFIYGGPGIVRDINRHLVRRLQENGFNSIDEAVGTR